MSILLNESACDARPASHSYTSTLAIGDPYTTDHHLCRLAQVRIRESGYAELQTVECECRDRILKLTGKVSSFYLKQVAQELIRALATDCLIRNQLEVQYPKALIDDEEF